jgi:hypothetical protein
MEHDALDVIAKSYTTIAETQKMLARTQRGLAWILGIATLLLGLSLLGAGLLIWQHLTQHQTHEAVTQTLTVQTQALAEILRRMPSP